MSEAPHVEAVVHRPLLYLFLANESRDRKR